MLHAVTGSRPGGGMCASIHAVIHVTTECDTCDHSVLDPTTSTELEEAHPIASGAEH